MQATPSTPHQHLLAELATMAMDIARTLHARITQPATAGEPPEDPTPLAAAFDRVARCARRTVLLADHLARPQQDPAQPLAHARRHLLRAMENKITRNDDPVDNPDALRRELRERLEGPDLAADLLTRPLPEIVEELCRDMGLDRWPFAPPFPRRTPADIARLVAEADGRPGPAATPWTHSGPTRLAPPRGKPDAQGITPEDRALHAHIMALPRKR